jgi:dTDP-4-dehydrorhamnose 3,5-epimerase
MKAEFERSLLPVDMDVTPDAPRDNPTVDDDGELLDTRLDGVELVRVSPHVDDRGSLIEIYNPSLKFWREPIVYSYSVLIRPERIKGWGMHKLQTDRYFVARGCLRVVLYDGRTDSPSYQRFAEFYFTDASLGLLRIPPGVWHADQNWGDTDALIVNFPTEPYDRANPDKFRIDPHSGEIPFDWKLKDR